MRKNLDYLESYILNSTSQVIKRLNLAASNCVPDDFLKSLSRFLAMELIDDCRH